MPQTPSLSQKSADGFQSPKSRNVKVALLQLSCSGDLQANWDKHLLNIRAAAAAGAQVICLQELFKSLYFCDIEDHANFALAEAVPGPGTDALGALAAELGVVIVASLFEKRAEGLYHNTTAVLDADGSYVGKYRKMHIPDDPGFYEKFYFTPGDLGYQVFPTRFGKIGVLICWDQWYPEAARLTALKGADFLVYPTAIGWDTSVQEQWINDEQYDAWQTVQRGHSVANGIPVISVNRVGLEAGTRFWGGSFVTNAYGRILWQGSFDTEEVHIQELDLAQSDHYRTTWPFFRDRRIETFGGLTKRWDD
jgi:N-carbamoylputrescine amidase